MVGDEICFFGRRLVLFAKGFRMPQLPATSQHESNPRLLAPPHGMKEILAMFGDHSEYLRPDGALDSKWQSEFLATASSPFPLLLAWDRTRYISRFACHRLLSEVLTAVFHTIQEQGLKATVHSFGGCFAFRQQRAGSKLSAHSWGIALDLNPETNQQGTRGNMDVNLVALFRSAGFTWGGDWEGRTRDPMHFQFCTGY